MTSYVPSVDVFINAGVVDTHLRWMGRMFAHSRKLLLESQETPTDCSIFVFLTLPNVQDLTGKRVVESGWSWVHSTQPELKN